MAISSCGMAAEMAAAAVLACLADVDADEAPAAALPTVALPAGCLPMGCLPPKAISRDAAAAEEADFADVLAEDLGDALDDRLAWGSSGSYSSSSSSS